MKIDGFIFDLDGTIYLGEEALPGAVDLIAELRRKNKKVLFVTNKPLEPRGAYAAKLTRMGIPTDPDDILTAAQALGAYLRKNKPGLRLYVIGEPNLRAEFREMGLQVLDDFFEQDEKHVIDPQGIDAVVVAFDRSLDYRKLNTAYQALLNGALFLATNADKACPMPGGSIPDAGATIAALEHISGREVDFLAGKPSEWMVRLALEQMRLPVERCLMVGDRLETDIFMGQQAGIHTALVLTGATQRQDLQFVQKPPTLVLESLAELYGWIE